MPEITSLQIAYLVIIVLSAILVGFIIRAMLRFDDKVEGRREIALDCAEFFNHIKWEHAAKLCRCYAIGDYSGILVVLKDLAGDIKDPFKRKMLVKNAVFGGLKELLEDPTCKAEIIALVNQPSPDIESVFKGTPAQLPVKAPA